MTKAGYQTPAYGNGRGFSKKQRNEAALKEDYSGEPVIQEHIDKMSDETLDFTLAGFVAEVRKEDGQEYPKKTQ